MSRAQLISLHASMALTTLTGAVFAYMKYFMSGADEFSVVNHPLQPQMLALHVVIAPIALFVLGWVFSSHMLPKYLFGNGQNRKTGVASMILIAPMVLSGYLLQVSTSEALREAMAIAHWVASALFLAIFLIHLIKPKAAAADR